MAVANYLTRLTAISLTVALALFCSVQSSHAAENEELLQERFAFWSHQAFYCKVDNITFPSRPTGTASQPCDDGDMTLFNGLLCFAGDERGCTGVREAQDPKTGEWFRSPRIRLRGNDRGGASFSPDMALGVQLYLLKTKDVKRAETWANWLHDLTPCSVENPFDTDQCWLWGLPRFCAPEDGCTMRPGDAAALSHTFDYMHAKHGMAPLPHGRLRGYLATFDSIGQFMTEMNSIFNKPGFSQHLVAVEVLIMKAIYGDKDDLTGIAKRLANKSENQGNAFFSYLAKRDRAQVISEVLARCPSPEKLPVPPLKQWQWERDNEDKAWEHSSYWDCIFMARLLGT
ncbi:hypothetical protein [Paracoccus yeei]|uniref:Cellulase n=1 Tax=Paracoccus yeei TaxID=147645 RepID=A0A2D2C1U1_9RHOB|nr:hypothetical protein [Paracoccus yeei]ATQ56359.1 hypothetical protein PYTT13_11400 [Paracoccus yeei]